MLMTNSHVSNVQNVPCSMCFSRNHANGECVEDNMWTYGSDAGPGAKPAQHRETRGELGKF